MRHPSLFVFVFLHNLGSSSKSNYISRCKFSFYFAKKSYFFYFIHSFLQNTHINLSILHIYSIKYSFFYKFLLFSPSPLFSHKPNPKGLKPISLKTTLSISLTDPNHHHTNHQILAPTKHSFITLLITSFIASSLQWVSKVDPPLLQLRRLIGASSSSCQCSCRRR